MEYNRCFQCDLRYDILIRNWLQINGCHVLFLLRYKRRNNYHCIWSIKTLVCRDTAVRYSYNIKNGKSSITTIYLESVSKQNVLSNARIGSVYISHHISGVNQSLPFFLFQKDLFAQKCVCFKILSEKNIFELI